VRPRFVTGGASNELFEIRRGDARMRTSTPPRKVPEGRNESMLREYRVLAALRGHGRAARRVLAACDDPSVLGACFYLMEYVDGWSCMSTEAGPRRSTAIWRRGEGSRGSWSTPSASRARVDWKARGLEGFGRPEGFHVRQVDRWLSHLKAFRFRDLPASRRRRRGCAATGRESYARHSHGDYQFANVMYRHGAPARMAAIVDWEMATSAIRSRPRLGGDGLAEPGRGSRQHGLRRLHGMPTARGAVRALRGGERPPVDEIDYYVILAASKSRSSSRGLRALREGRRRQPEDGGLRRRRPRHGTECGRAGAHDVPPPHEDDPRAALRSDRPGRRS
jgi:hypothetical protein